MKRTVLLLMNVAFLTLASCYKEGPAGPAGPAGPTGPTGPAGANGIDGADGIDGTNGINGSDGVDGVDGDDAGLTINSLTIAVADWAGSSYVEYPAEFITADIYDSGIAIAYIQDDFGYWNSIPSQWHEITGFAYTFTDADGDGTADTGVVGFDAVNDTPTADVIARVITMTTRDYQVLSSNGSLNNYNAVMSYLKENK